MYRHISRLHKRQAIIYAKRRLWVVCEERLWLCDFHQRSVEMCRRTVLDGCLPALCDQDEFPAYSQRRSVAIFRFIAMAQPILSKGCTSAASLMTSAMMSRRCQLTRAASPASYADRLRRIRCKFQQPNCWWIIHRISANFDRWDEVFRSSRGRERIKSGRCPVVRRGLSKPSLAKHKTDLNSTTCY